MKNHRVQKDGGRGFTLIELSIVLVIIGLLVGGILVGQDLIKAAEIRKQVKAIEQYNVAATTFKLKYTCMAGDCSTAEAKGLGSAGGPGANGDGDEKITMSVTIGTILDSREATNFWYHLFRAGLLADTVTGYISWPTLPGIVSPLPKIKSKSTNSFFGNPASGVTLLPLDLDSATFGLVDMEPLFNTTSPYKTVWWITPSWDYFSPSSGVFLAAETYMLDSKIDDGLPREGTMRTITHSLQTWNSSSADTPNCINYATTPYTYNFTSIAVSGFSALCSPMILTNF
jgi:prepilin-type N-terminal cleavage/methylation domain-containing protein